MASGSALGPSFRRAVSAWWWVRPRGSGTCIQAGAGLAPRHVEATEAIEAIDPLGETFNVIAQSPEILSEGLKRRAPNQRTVIMNQPLQRCGSCTIYQIAATRCGGTHSLADAMGGQIPNDV